MNIDAITVGGVSYIKEVPQDTKILMAWNASWTFERRKIETGSYRRFELTPMIDGDVFLTPDDTKNTLAKPSVELAIVITLRVMNKTQRRAMSRLKAAKEYAVAKVNGEAWLLSEHDFERCINGGIVHQLTDSTKLFLPDLVGQKEFNELVSKLKSIVRKM